MFSRIAHYMTYKLFGGLNLTGKHSVNMVHEVMVESLTRIRIKPNKKYRVTLSFEPFEKARKFFFNGQSLNNLGMYSTGWLSKKKVRKEPSAYDWDTEFICPPYLKRFLGRYPKHGEIIYYRLEKIK